MDVSQKKQRELSSEEAERMDLVELYNEFKKRLGWWEKKGIFLNPDAKAKDEEVFL